MTAAATAQDRANGRLTTIGRTYHERVPYTQMILSAEVEGWNFEGSTKEAPIFHSNEGRCSLACWYRDEVRERAQDALHRLVGGEKNVPITRRNLHFTWYKMESGRYEIVAHLS